MLISWGIARCIISLPPTVKTVTLARVALHIRTMPISSSTTAAPIRNTASNNTPSEVTTRPLGVVTSSNMALIEDFLALDHRTLDHPVPREVVAVTTAICNGLRPVQSVAARKIKISLGVIPIPSKLRLRFLTNHPEIRSPQPSPMRTITHSDLQRTCKWRTKIRRTKLPL